jgi:hypothetical protein
MSKKRIFGMALPPDENMEAPGVFGTDFPFGVGGVFAASAKITQTAPRFGLLRYIQIEKERKKDRQGRTHFSYARVLNG